MDGDLAREVEEALCGRPYILQSIQAFVQHFQADPPPPHHHSLVLHAFASEASSQYLQWTAAPTPPLPSFPALLLSHLFAALHDRLVVVADNDDAFVGRLGLLGRFLGPAHLDLHPPADFLARVRALGVQLREVARCRDWRGKLDVLAGVSGGASAAVGGGEGADALVPTLVLVVVHAAVSNLRGHLRFCEESGDFEPDGHQAYVLVTFGLVLTFLENLEASLLTIPPSEYAAHMAGDTYTASPTRHSDDGDDTPLGSTEGGGDEEGAWWAEHLRVALENRERRGRSLVELEFAKPATFEGWLDKRGQVSTLYRSRWFELRGSCLFYFPHQHAASYLGCIPLQRTFVRSDAGSATKFQICDPKRVWKLRANTSAHKTLWLRHLSTTAIPAGIVRNRESEPGPVVVRRRVRTTPMWQCLAGCLTCATGGGWRWFYEPSWAAEGQGSVRGWHVRVDRPAPACHPALYASAVLTMLVFLSVFAVLVLTPPWDSLFVAVCLVVLVLAVVDTWGRWVTRAEVPSDVAAVV